MQGGSIYYFYLIKRLFMRKFMFFAFKPLCFVLLCVIMTLVAWFIPLSTMPQQLTWLGLCMAVGFLGRALIIFLHEIIFE
jgi:hypothetical protein